MFLSKEIRFCDKNDGPPAEARRQAATTPQRRCAGKQNDYRNCRATTFKSGTDIKMISTPLLLGVNKHSCGDMKNNTNYPSSSKMMKGSSSGVLSNVSRVSSPKSSPHIADDIRNDGELMFADDIDQAPELTLPQSAAESGTPESHLHQPPSHRHGSCNVPSSRRSSQAAIADLQREVDMALEFFSQEADNSSDDDYMNNEVQYMPIHKGERVRFNTSGGGDCDDSYPSTAATSLSHSDHFDNDTDNGQNQPISSNFPSTPVRVGGGLSLKHKTKSLISLPLSLLPSQTTVNCAEEEDFSTGEVANFDTVICEELQSLGITPEQHAERSFAVDFESNHSLRNAMEPFLSVARECHSAICNITISFVLKSLTLQPISSPYRFKTRRS